MSSASSRHRANKLLASSKGGKGLEPIRFPLGWDSKIGGIFSWYDQQTCTRFASIQHRKDRQFPFYHEFLCVKLTNGEICQFEWVGDPNARTDALTQEGSLAHDYVETHPHDQLVKLDNTSDIIKEITFPSALDLLDVLEICYHIQEDTETRSYTLQRFNCYFFSWCILLVLTQIFSPRLEGISRQQWSLITRDFENRFSNASNSDKESPTGHDSSVFLCCEMLDHCAISPSQKVIAILCDALSNIGLADLNKQIRGKFWASWTTEDICTVLDADMATVAGSIFDQSPAHNTRELLRMQGRRPQPNHHRFNRGVAQPPPLTHIYARNIFSISDFRDDDNAPGM
jgi:hypothetical protein